MQNLLSKLTQSGDDDETVDSMAVQIGLPQNITRLINKMKAGNGSLQLSDGQISIQFEM